jgi:predicted alpha-1,6-mannanase (GH76 family)
VIAATGDTRTALYLGVRRKICGARARVDGLHETVAVGWRRNSRRNSHAQVVVREIGGKIILRDIAVRSSTVEIDAAAYD